MTTYVERDFDPYSNTNTNLKSSFKKKSLSISSVRELGRSAKILRFDLSSNSSESAFSTKETETDTFKVPYHKIFMKARKRTSASVKRYVQKRRSHLKENSPSQHSNALPYFHLYFSPNLTIFSVKNDKKKFNMSKVQNFLNLKLESSQSNTPF